MDKTVIKIIEEIVERITFHFEEPLDGDETEAISKRFLLELDILQGNLTQDEYNQELIKLEKNRG